MKFKAILALLALAAAPAHAEDATLRIGWQQIVEPARVPQAEGTYDTETGAKVEWLQFGGGADVIAAIASGSIDIGYVGSSPLTAGVSRGLPIETIYVVGNIAEAEALAVKGISDPKDLVGKKIATPFVSTAHYSLLSALKHWGIDAKQVQLLNLRPQDIAAAWERGDLDGAYVWDPVLQQIKSTGGTVLADSADVAGWGAPTFDAWIVRKDYAEKHPEIVTAFVKVTGAATDAYLADPAAFTPESPQVKAIADLTGAKPEDVPQLLQGYKFAGLKDQASPAFLGGETVKAISDTAAFLVEQGSIPAALPDYSAAVAPRFATAAQ